MIDSQKTEQQEIPVLIFALIFPTILTYSYFILLVDYPTCIQQSVYSIGKIIQFILPALFVFSLRKGPPQISLPSRSDLMTGGVFGLVALGLGIWGHYAWFIHYEHFPEVVEAVRSKLDDLNFTGPLVYIGMSFFYSLIHSFLEEYYWRWFVFGRLRNHCTDNYAIIIASIGFMAHHVLILATFFSWNSPITYLFSLFVALGGAFWAYLFKKSGSLWGAWLSHALIDAMIFYIGYQMIF